MARYHIATGDGKAYYGVNYESYREAKAVLEFSQKRDPQAHIVEEEYHFTNADRIRAMSDEELAVFVHSIIIAEDCLVPGCGCDKCFFKEPCFNESKWHGKEMEWLKQPAEGE